MKVLFISHNASRTGAPLYLLNLCRYLKQNTDWELFFLLKASGPLINDFKALGATFFFDRSSGSITARLANKIKIGSSDFNFNHWLLKQKIKQLQVDVIYSNTSANGSVLQFLQDLNTKVVTHVHELAYVVKSLGEENLDLVKKHTNNYITSSPSVTRYLTQTLKVSSTIVKETKCFPLHINSKEFNSVAVKAELSLPTDSFIIGSAGTVEWRKGWDLFIRLAEQLRKTAAADNFYLVWVGNLDAKARTDVEMELKLSGVEAKVIFTGATPTPEKYFSIFDVFCLMSREEAFGIVALEAALYQTPVICFEGAEGLSTFVKNDAGYVIPDLDTSEMAKSIIELSKNLEKKNRMGRIASNRVIDEYSISTQAEKIVNLLEEFVS